MEVKEQVVLTPKSKTSNVTTLWIERKAVEVETNNDSVYVAQGDHRGIIVNKEKLKDEVIIPPPQLSIEFRVFLVNSHTKIHTQEIRTLRFWFRNVLETESEQATITQEFFRNLVHPKEFPRDYVGFIKKIMKLLQQGFQGIVRIELVLCQMGSSEISDRSPSTDDLNSEKVVELTEEKLVEVMESHYPNPITIPDISRDYDWEEEEVRLLLSRLQKKGVIKSIEHGGYTRVMKGDAEVKIVKQMPKMVRAYQPTIAIITAQFTEKLAVDAMMSNKETFVRIVLATERVLLFPRVEYMELDLPLFQFGIGPPLHKKGESNVYTLGNIGEHRIVCTKLPSVGFTREAMTAAGNTTTRLLGTFQEVEHVILVGVGGGVPHFTDYNKHIRLGDVVISHASPNSESIYITCEGATETSPDEFDFDVVEYRPKVAVLQNIAAQIKVQYSVDNAQYLWKYLDEGLALLETESEHDFKRPLPDTDKLYMAIGDRDLIEVSHPMPHNNVKRIEDRPRIHLGLIGAGREIARSDHFRQKFSSHHHIVTYVSEFDPVIQSIIGNCRDSFIFVRGICDYKDGTKKTEWQPYAALAAASVTKAIISALDPNPS